LNTRPKWVSSGKTVWQAAHAMPVWRAKLGTAHAGSAAPQSSSRAQNPPGQAGRASLEEKHEVTAGLPRHAHGFVGNQLPVILTAKRHRSLSVSSRRALSLAGRGTHAHVFPGLAHRSRPAPIDSPPGTVMLAK